MNLDKLERYIDLFYSEPQRISWDKWTTRTAA